jgi:exopolysaccharide biosynthesis polyprenyl glycosylphosphotransferase
MFRQFSTRRIAGFFLLDWLGSLAVLAIAAIFRAKLGNLPPSLADLATSLEVTLGGASPQSAQHIILSLPSGVFSLVALIWPFFLVTYSVYDGRRNATLKAELRNVFLAICVSALTLAGTLYVTYRETSRVLFIVFIVLDVVLLLGSRIVLSVYRRTKSGQNLVERRPLLVVGAGVVGQNAVAQLKRYAWADIEVVGYLDDDPGKQGQQFEGVPVLGALDQLPTLVESHHIRTAVVALPLRAHERLVETCQALQKLSVHVHVIPDLFALSFPSATMDGLGGIPVIDLGLPGIHGWQRFCKRTFDAIVATLLLLLLSPLLVVIAVLIKIGSPGPVFYRQSRIGENGQQFTMLKFRSMNNDVDQNTHKAHMTRLIKENISLEHPQAKGQNSLKMEHDPRITRVGKIIRRTSIDELPQLINVLRGEMSLVGPRPPLPYEVDLYQQWHKRRLEALPGITGWWQVKGRNRVSFDEQVRMDLYYIEHSSFWFDLRILLLTPWAALSGQGAS